jgi:hypothetical protein
MTAFFSPIQGAMRNANQRLITPLRHLYNKDGAQASKAKAANRGSVTKTVTTTGPSQQMSFEWS